MWQIDKKIDGISYGHRVWTQELNPEFSLDSSCACKHMHGHNASVHVFLSSDTLDNGFVTDFKHINWVKKMLDDYIDHKFVLDLNDPLFERILNCEREGDRIFVDNYHLDMRPVYLVSNGVHHTLGWVLEGQIDDPHQIEFYEGFFIVNFVPTSENLCKWIYDAVQFKMDQIGINVSRIDWYETPKSRSSYRA